jgi:hypothetical protein
VVNLIRTACNAVPDPLLKAECVYMIDVYGVLLLEFVHDEGDMPTKVCETVGLC